MGTLSVRSRYIPGKSKHRHLNLGRKAEDINRRRREAQWEGARVETWKTFLINETWLVVVEEWGYDIENKNPSTFSSV